MVTFLLWIFIIFFYWSKMGVWWNITQKMLPINLYTVVAVFMTSAEWSSLLFRSFAYSLYTLRWTTSLYGHKYKNSWLDPSLEDDPAAYNIFAAHIICGDCVSAFAMILRWFYGSFNAHTIHIINTKPHTNTHTHIHSPSDKHCIFCCSCGLENVLFWFQRMCF